MKKFLSALKMAFAIQEMQSRMDACTEEWTDGDTAALKSFLVAPIGRKLAAVLRNDSAAAMFQAVQKGTVHECGRAFGFVLCIAHIQNLAGIGSPKDAEQSEDAGDTGLPEDLEHYRP